MTDATTKAGFIAALRRFAEVGGAELYDPVYKRTGYREHRGERILARGIATYLDGEGIPGDVRGINWLMDLHSHLVDAFVEFRSARKWRTLRDTYRMETGEEMFDLVEVHIGGLHRLLAAKQIARLPTVLSGELWLQPKLEGYFDAQQNCIDQAWERFVRIGYRQLMPRIKKETHRGNRGTFGATTLMTYCMAGRCMFTFSRGGDSMTYVADDEDMHGERSGPNAASTPYAECVAMINEVSNHWDMEKMVSDDEVIIAGLATGGSS